MRTCILHIGMPKTGTMSVQASLGQAKALAPGFKYIAFDKETNCSDALMEIFAKEVPLRERGQRVDWGPDKVAAARQKQLDLLQCGFDRSDCHTFILSGERLHNLSVPHLTALRDELLRHVDEVRVLAYVRDAASWIESAFQQRLKTGDGADFNNLRRVMPEFRLKLERFDQVFGRDKVVLRKFEPATFAGNDVVLDFCHWISLPFDAAQVIRDNEGISRDRAALIYIYRHFIKKPQMTLADKADVRLLMRQTRSLAGPKLRMAPAVIAPYLQQIEVDMAWMEGRLGASVSTPPREQEGMLTCEADLLSPTPTMVEWLAQPPNDPTWLTPGEQPTGEAVAKAAARLIKNLRDKQAKTAKPAAKTAKAPGKPGKPVKPAAVAPVSPAEG